MNEIANVVYPYSPKNDDELELQVGDKIEVICEEEQGWWKGRLKGRVGVFPSNFVHVTGSTTQAQPILSSQTPIINSGEKLPQSSNNKSPVFNSFTNSNNNNNSTSPNNNNNSKDNNSSVPSHMSNNNKQNRAASYVEMLASSGKNKPLPAEPGHDRPNPALGTLQIPKKRPPPLPNNTSSEINYTNNSENSSDQAPALPPKPSSHVNPMLPMTYKPPHPLAQVHQQGQQQQQQSALHKQVPLQQARVKYAYQPANDDELAIEVGDIINVLEMEIEDAGWWKGELRGKVGVFPDNFVELIKPPELDKSPSINNIASSRPTMANSSSVPNFAGNNESKLKVFAGTPKGFSKELESNLEKQHQNHMSFLSLKRYKQQQEADLTNNEDKKLEDADDNASYQSSGSTRLNHMTANRAKGPSRRPPTNLSNKRVQNTNEPNRQDLTNGHNQGSLANSSPSSSTNDRRDSNTAQNTDNPSPMRLSAHNAAIETSPLSNASHTSTILSSVKTSPPVENINANESTKDQNTPMLPKTSQRLAQAPGLADKSKVQTPTTNASGAPQWMVNLKKVTAEKKRDPSSSSTTANNVGINLPPPDVNSAPDESSNVLPSTVSKIDKDNTVVADRTTKSSPSTVVSPSTPVATSSVSSVTSTIAAFTSGVHSQKTSPDSSPISTRPTSLVPPPQTPLSAPKTDVSSETQKMLETEVKSLKSELLCLREDVQKLDETLSDFGDLKRVVESMQEELKTCQSAIDSQKRYIKELVSNLTAEKTKIAAMQMEIDRNLK